MGGWNGWLMRLEGATTINTDTIVAAVVGAVFGGSGLTGLLFIYMRRFIDKRLDRREQVEADRKVQQEKEDAKRKAQRLQRLTIDAEMEHATGRLFFFVHKAIVTGQHNGDLESAWEEYQAAENRKKALNRQIIVESELDE